jgi:hypothetical protein
VREVAIEEAFHGEAVGSRIVEIAEVVSPGNLHVLCMMKPTRKFVCGLDTGRPCELANLRLAASRLETRAFYFVIPRDNEANPFSTFSTPPNANNVSTPITVNNPGENNRDLLNTSLKSISRREVLQPGGPLYIAHQ